jgi:hypothetical protein
VRVRPTCKKCGEQHWYFVACDEAAARNTIEDQKATVTALNVMPVWRSGTPFAGDRLVSVDRTPGTNTYWRKPDNDKAA